MVTGPVNDALRMGWDALMLGDTAERDRQVERARKIMDAQEAMPKADASPAQIAASLVKLAELKMGRSLTATERSVIQEHPAAFMRRLLAQGDAIPGAGQ